MIRSRFIFGLLCFSFITQAHPPKLTKDAFIKQLIKRMTLEEKIGQLTLFTSDMSVTGPVMRDSYKEDIKKGRCGNIFNAYTPEYTRTLQDLAMQSRLKIPLLFGYDVIHGHKTIFPIPLGESASWDTVMMEKTAQIAAKEASADGLHWTYSPMVDIARDPRWGRVSEGAGEDPVLGAAIARSKVRGYQGTHLASGQQLIACVKHFALYGAPIAGRDYNTVDMSLQTMYNVYLTPYKAAVQAGAASVMTSFNEINGIPSSANRWLLNDLLRKEWGFKGFIVTDYTSINEMVNHGNVADEYEAGVAALHAGVDMDMQGSVYLTYLEKALQKGDIQLSEIEQAVYRVLAAKYDLGLFEDPYRFCDNARPAHDIMTPQHLSDALEMAKRSIVLLKNANHILPLAKKEQRIAVIGPMVKNKRDLIGNWSGAGNWRQAKSLWEGLTEKYGNTIHFNYALGSNSTDDSTLIHKMHIEEFLDYRPRTELIREAVAVAKSNDIILLALGESEGMSGEASSRSDITLPETQKELLAALKETGIPIVLLLSNGRPLVLTKEQEQADAILETWFLGTMSGYAITDVLFGDFNPSGKLSMSFPRSVGQIPVFYAAKHTGRPFDENQKYTSKYLDISNSPLYPFGYGLSYTQFTYSNIQLDKSVIYPNQSVEVSFDVTNSGEADGFETVQLYLQDMVGSSTRPVRELKRFSKIYLHKNESIRVKYTLSMEDLKYFNASLKYNYEPGTFQVYVGSDSNADLKSRFELKIRPVKK